MYQKTLFKIAPDLNPAGVEASMRLQYHTLNHLTHDTFVAEAKLARLCEQAEPGYLRRVATSFGMRDEFEHWETKLNK